MVILLAPYMLPRIYTCNYIITVHIHLSRRVLATTQHSPMSPKKLKCIPMISCRLSNFQYLNNIIMQEEFMQGHRQCGRRKTGLHITILCVHACTCAHHSNTLTGEKSCLLVCLWLCAPKSYLFVQYCLLVCIVKVLQ